MTIRLLDFASSSAHEITRFASAGASSVELGHGHGESHVYAVHFAAGGSIGPHPAGFDQLFLVVRGDGWVAGADGARVAVGANQAAFVPEGEVHSKGSDTGMLAIMVQTSRLSTVERPSRS